MKDEKTRGKGGRKETDQKRENRERETDGEKERRR